MQLHVSAQGSLRLTAETQAEMIQLNQLLNQISLTNAAAISNASSSADLAETKFISLQLQTTK